MSSQHAASSSPNRKGHHRESSTRLCQSAAPKFRLQSDFPGKEFTVWNTKWAWSTGLVNTCASLSCTVLDLQCEDRSVQCLRESKQSFHGLWPPLSLAQIPFLFHLEKSYAISNWKPSDFFMPGVFAFDDEHFFKTTNSY